MAESEKISVLICTHSRCQQLAKTLESIGWDRAADSIDREVVVVDNASRDRTRDAVEEFAARSSISVRYILEKRLGKSHALNTGISQCSGSIVAFTDDDAIVAPDWLERIGQAFQENHAGIVFGKVDPLWETEPPPWFTRRDHGRFALLDYGSERFLVEDPNHAFHGVNLAIRRGVLDSLGGFRTDKGPCGIHGGVGEDTDLFDRALASGIRILYDPKVVVQHFIPSIRCSKGFHRNGIRNGRWQYYRFVHESEMDFPQLLGLPRYRYRLAIYNIYKYIIESFKGEKSEQFHYELQIRRFFWLFVQSRSRDGVKFP